MKKNLIHYPVLVLDSTYIHINVVPAKKAISYIVRDRAKSVEFRTEELINGEHKIPSIIRLSSFVSHRTLSKIKVKFNKKALFDRDLSSCQYCGEILSIDSATIDHVIPRTLGGKTCWENCVISCKGCNSSKGNKNLNDVGLILKKEPKRPHYITRLKNIFKKSNKEESWNPYFLY